MPNGSLAARRAYSRETANEKQELEVLKLISLTGRISNVSGVAPGLPFSARGLFFGMNINPSPEITNQVQQSLEKVAAIDARKEQRATQNANSMPNPRAMNSKAILSSISGLPADTSVESLWDWWPSFNENPTTAEKPVSRISILDDSSYVVVPTQETLAQIIALPSTECLVAGTVIQTSCGLRKIEEIRIGDTAVSMNVDSGEISMRPIINVSNRIAAESYKITVGNGEVIQATGGHNWWVLGQGWLRSRQLKAGQFMRTGDASVEIKKIEKIDGPIKVYNMIVDKTHTYFVGQERLLSWDVTSLQPTLQRVPGREMAVYASASK
jgi:hypothetical protein